MYSLELNIANLTDGKKVVYVKRYIEKADYETAQKIKKAETAGKTRLNQPSGTRIRNPEPVVNNESQKIFSHREITPISNDDMNKWTNGAKKRRVVIDGQKAKSDELDVIVTAMAQLPPGQLKKVLSEDVVAVLEKYGAAVEQG